mgnify:CR=1 FL=1
MSIDGVGRPPIPPGGAGSVTGPSAAPGATETFEVAPSEAASASAPANTLARLERGELSVEQYLDLRVDEAVAPLAGRLAPADLEMVKGSLRAELETDPVLIELVRRATGASPTEAER